MSLISSGVGVTTGAATTTVSFTGASIFGSNSSGILLEFTSKYLPLLSTAAFLGVSFCKSRLSVTPSPSTSFLSNSNSANFF